MNQGSGASRSIYSQPVQALFPMIYAKLISTIIVLSIFGCSGVDTSTKAQVSATGQKSRKPTPSKPVLPSKTILDTASVNNTLSGINPPTDSSEHATSRAAAMANREAALAIADSYRCSACHRTEGKLLGPSWKAVAHKYQSDPDAAKKISLNIKRGGNFGWKSGLMPAKGGSHISEAEINRLAELIASFK